MPSAVSTGLTVLGRDAVICMHMAGKAEEVACKICQQAQKGELMAAKVSSLKCQVKDGAKLALTKRGSLHSSGPWLVELAVLDGNDLPSGMLTVCSAFCPISTLFCFLFHNKVLTDRHAILHKPTKYFTMYQRNC